MTDLTAALDALDRHAAGVRSGAAKALSNASQVTIDLADVLAAADAIRATATPTPVPIAQRVGVPQGTVLTVHHGDYTITEPGTVIENLDIRGYLRIKAANVTVRRCIIRGRDGLTGSMALVQNSSPGVVVEDCELVADHPTYYVDGFVGSNVTFRRVSIHGVVDCVKIIGDNVTVEDSLLHGNLYYPVVPSGGDTHSDSVQIGVGTGIVLRRVTMTGATNAAVMVTQDRGPVVGLVIEDCDLDGGPATINLAEKSYGPIAATITRCRFGRTSTWPVLAALTTQAASTITGCVYADDGTPITVKRG